MAIASGALMLVVARASRRRGLRWSACAGRCSSHVAALTGSVPIGVSCVICMGSRRRSLVLTAGSLFRLAGVVLGAVLLVGGHGRCVSARAVLPTLRCARIARNRVRGSSVRSCVANGRGRFVLRGRVSGAECRGVLNALWGRLRGCVGLVGVRPTPMRGRCSLALRIRVGGCWWSVPVAGARTAGPLTTLRFTTSGRLLLAGAMSSRT